MKKSISRTEAQNILMELAKMDIKVLAYHVRGLANLNTLVVKLAWAYNADDVRSGKMREELEYAYESDNK